MSLKSTQINPQCHIWKLASSSKDIFQYALNSHEDRESSKRCLERISRKPYKLQKQTKTSLASHDPADLLLYLLFHPTKTRHLCF